MRIINISLYLCFFIVLTLTPTILMAAEPESKKRPTVGLVLSGGGALGFAHVGILKVLEEQRVPIDYITGTSMGAIVGAAYASGIDLKEMEDVLSNSDWNAVFSEEVSRQDLSYRFKPGRDRELFGATKFSVKDGSLVIPSGLIEGVGIEPLFRKLFRKAPSPVEFDQLPVPFRAVSANIETGQEMIFEKGDLASVVRASMSVPGAFSAVEIDGHYLVDGGIVNNTPIDVVQEMGADIVIAIKLHVDLAKKDELTNPFSITGQMISLLILQNSERQLKNLRKGDILLEPDLTGQLATSFNSGAEILKIGEDYARENISLFSNLGISEQAYKAYQTRRQLSIVENDRIDFIRVNNESTMTDKKLNSYITVKEGDLVDHDQLAEISRQIFKDGRMLSSNYSIIEEKGKQGVVFTAKGKPWLNHYFRIGFAMEDDLRGDSAYRLSLGYRDVEIDPNGGYVDLNFEIGEQPNVFSEWYHPFSRLNEWFMAPSVNFGTNKIDVRSNGNRIAEYDRTVGNIDLLLGRTLGRSSEFRLGARRGFGETDLEIGDPLLQDISYDIGEAFVGVVHDRLDTIDFPTAGQRFLVNFRSSMDEFGATENFNDIRAGFSLPYSFGRNTVIFAGDMGETFEERPIERSFSLGGFLDVSGYPAGGLSASDYWTAKMVYFRRVSEYKTPIFGLSYFLGASFETAGVHSDTPVFESDPLIIGGSVFVGIDTPLLPFYLSFGSNDDRESTFYLTFGRIPGRRGE